MVRAYKKRTLLKFVCSADYVARGTIVAYTDAYFVFGGAWHYIDSNTAELSNKIGRLDYATLKWSPAGKLVSRRIDFGVIYDHIISKEFVVVGGGGEKYNERCFLSNDTLTMTCEHLPHSMVLSNNRNPLLFLMDLGWQDPPSETIGQTTTLSDSSMYTTQLNSTTTPSNEPKAPSVLVLNQRKNPIILNRDGQVKNDFNENFYDPELFYSETEVKLSCGVTWRNQHYVFGGTSKRADQIAQVVDPGCSLKIIGKLEKTPLVNGACTVMNDKIYICFNYPPTVTNSIDCKICYVSENGPLGPWTTRRGLTSNEPHCVTHIANSGCK